MKRLLSVVVVLVVLSALIAGCGAGGTPVTKDLDGKISAKIEKGADPKTKKVTFKYFLDKKGLTAISAVIVNEIKNAEKAKNGEKAKNLKAILTKFNANGFANAAKIVKGISVAGPFNGWKANKDVMTAGKVKTFVVYSISKEWGFSVQKPAYKFPVSLNIGKSLTDLVQVWVPDPNAAETKPDGFGGKNAVLFIKDFPVAADAK